MESSVTNISVVMIDSRSDKHPDWVQGAISSVNKQIYPVKLAVVNNVGRHSTIGKCWNEAVKQCDTDWILFLGDDDWLSFDYCQMLHNWTRREDTRHAVCFTTNMTVFREDGQERHKELPRACTGMWKREYLLKYPFNETLSKGIDREYIEEVEKRGDTKILIHYHSGYHYRQHDDYSCAGKISLTHKSSPVYINSTYPIHTNIIAQRLKKDYEVTVDNHVFSPLSAEGAKVIWCDWGNRNAVAIGSYETDARKILRIHAYEVFEPSLHYIPFERFDKVIFVAEHIRDYAEEVLKRKIKNSLIIPNSVDLNAFYAPKNKKFNKRIAYCGELSRKKGLQLMFFIAESFPEYEFHVAGKFTEPDMAHYFFMKKPKNVHLKPYSYDLNEFFKDKTFYLHTSPREGCPVTLLQAMASGLRPICYDFVGAAQIMRGDSFVFRDLKKVKRILNYAGGFGHIRSFIAENYNIEKIYPLYKKIVDDLYGNFKSHIKNTG